MAAPGGGGSSSSSSGGGGSGGAGDGDAGAAAARLCRMEGAVRALLEGIGEDPEREGLRDTPKRVARAFLDTTEGYRASATSVIGTALFHEDVIKGSQGSLVLVRDVEFASTSEDTLLPFHGRCHVAYVPSQGAVLGLSKLARLVRLQSKKLQTQERLARGIVASLVEVLHPVGAAVLLEAHHLTLQDAQQQQYKTLTKWVTLDLEGLVALLGTRLEDVTFYGAEKSTTLVPDAEMTATASSVQGPTTPDPSEGDGMTTDDGSSVDQDLSALEVAVEVLLSESGIDVRGMDLHGSIRKYVQALLEATSGYHQSTSSPRAGSGDDTFCTLPEGQAEVLPAGYSAERSSLQECDDLLTTCTIENKELGGQKGCRCHIVRLRFMSQCEHHMLPFYGEILVGVAQTSERSLVGRSTIEAVVRVYSKRLQIQERFTQQVANALQSLTHEGSVVVVTEAVHMCMVARGVETHAARTLSIATHGLFNDNATLRHSIIREIHSK